MHRPAGFAAKGQAIETVAGEIDFPAVPQLCERLLVQAASSRHVVTDPDQVSFIDAAGVNALLGAANRTEVHGWTRRWQRHEPQPR